MTISLDAIILAGGRGTRLSSVVSDVPKPLAPIAGRPFLDHIIDFLKASKIVRRIIVSAGYKADLMRRWAAECVTPLEIVVIEELAPLGTGGALLHSINEISTTKTIVVMNGDSIARFDLSDMLANHGRSNFPMTIAVTHVNDVARYGEVEIVGNQITAFREKISTPNSGWVNAGIYMINIDVLKTLSLGVSSFERDIIPLLLPAGIGAYRLEGQFVDIGTPESYAKAASLMGLEESPKKAN